MKINRDSWHARIYRWWYREKHGHEPGGVNLCPYVRVVLFWAHARALFLTKFGYVSWSLLGLGLEYAIWRTFGLKGLATEGEVLLILLGAAAIVGALIGIIAGSIWLGGKTKGAVSGSSFVQVVVERQKAMHSKICPLVEFESTPAAPARGDGRQ